MASTDLFLAAGDTNMVRIDSCSVEFASVYSNWNTIQGDRQMGIGTVLGYAFGGVATMVALPILAPVGAITVAGAVLGAGAGALAGAVKSSIDEDEKATSKNQLRNAEEEVEAVSARLAAQEKRFAEKMKNVSERFSEHRQYEDFLIAVYAMAVSVSNCDGEIHSSERRDLEEFISGIARVKKFL